MGSGAPGGAGGARAAGGVVSGSFLAADEPGSETISGGSVAGAVPQTGEGGRAHGGVDGRAGSGLVLREPAKTHYRGKPLQSEAKPEARTQAGVRPHNEVRFLLNLLAYEILHLGRVLMEQATRRGWSLRRFHERVLRVASRVIRQGRRLIFVISQGAADWKRLWKRLARMSWAPG